MKWINLTLALLLALASAKTLLEPLDEWESFKREFNKEYGSPEEEEKRKAIFMQNVDKIKAHNELYKEGNSTFYMGVNKMTDMTFDEIIKARSCVIKTLEDIGQANLTNENFHGADIPESVDWRTSNYVTPVQDEGNCKACWAFSVVGALEGQLALKTNKLVPLSAQNLIDCSWPEGNYGCNGGIPYLAFHHILTNDKRGIDRADKYPYTGKNGSCHYSTNDIGATMEAFEIAAAGNETALAIKLAKNGPILAIIRVTPNFTAYKGGILQDDRAQAESFFKLAVLIVGYGSSPDGANYWIVKNSWGTRWGNEGYAWLAKDKKNSFFIASETILPILSS